MKRNYFTKKLGDIKPVVTDNRFLNEDGRVDWKTFGVYIDDDGFDTRYDIVETTLPKDTKLARFGPAGGRNTTLKGTSYDEVSLPYDINTVEYHEYVVKRDLTVYVKKGIVASDFYKAGGGVQFLHLKPIADDVKEKNLKEVKWWVLIRKMQQVFGK